MDENNNFQNMGPDPSLLSGNPQPQGNPYGQPQQPDPYAQPQQPDPYAQPQQADPYAQPQANPYGQPQGDPYAQPQQADPYAQPQANPYGQPQANPYGQPQGDPYGQSQADPYAQSGPAMEYSNQPSQDFGYQPGPGAAAQAPQPPKKKTGLIIGIIIAAVVLIGGGIAAFFLLRGSSDGKDGAEKVCKKFLNAYGDLDVDEMYECFPEEMVAGIAGSDFSGSKKEVEQAMSFLKGMFEIDDIEIENSEFLSDSELSTAQDKFNKANNCNVKFEKGARVNSKFTMKISFLGQSQEEEQKMAFICAYKGKKWYIIDASEDGKIEDEITEEEITTESEVDDGLDDMTEDDTEDDDSDESEAFVSTASSKVVDAPAGLSDKLEDLQFSFEGNIYSIPFPLADLPSDWHLIFDLDEDEKNIAAGESSYSNGYRNDKYDSSCSVYITVKNNTNAEIPYEQGEVTSFTLSIAYCEDGGQVPEVIFPKGITWGSTEEDIKNAYGDDYSVYDTSDGETRTITFSMNDYADTVSFYIDHEDGLNYVYLNHYEY